LLIPEKLLVIFRDLVLHISITSTSESLFNFVISSADKVILDNYLRIQRFFKFIAFSSPKPYKVSDFSRWK
jgi:hypothetical protein